jgi:hypothetical protein
MSDKSSKDIAADIRDTLLNQQALIKKATVERDDAMRRSASLEVQTRVMQDVLDLVSKGVIDATDAVSKVAEFLQDPQSLEVLKQAYLLGFDSVPRMGTPQSNEEPTVSQAEAPLVAVLREIEARKQ